MFKIRNLLRGIFFSKRNISKKMYTCGMIVISACLVVTVLIMGTNGFNVSGKNVKMKSTILSNDDEVMETTAEIDLLEFQNEDDEESSLYLSSDEKLSKKHVLTTEDVKQNKNTRTLRTATNNVSNKKVTLLSKTDYKALIKIVEAEATGEDITGKIMVANVVMNRVRSKRFPSSIYKVVHQKIKGKAQFSPISDGRYYSVPVKKSTYEAVERALKGEDYSNGALFFVARSIASEDAVSWFDRALKKVAQHGTHEFFAYK